MVNTVLVGLAMASFGLTAPGQPFALHVLQLLFFGAVNSLQFTAMNTITLKDLDGSMASSGNSLLSMVQMLAMSMGVAAAGAVLAGYNGVFGTDTAVRTLDAFQATFASMGLIDLQPSPAEKTAFGRFFHGACFPARPCPRVAATPLALGAPPAVPAPRPALQ